MLCVTLPVIDPDWLVVDIGGGNEGLVSRAGGPRVCAIDIQMDKIREAQIYQQSAQWVCADGRKLCIQDASADVVTLWFSLGYLPILDDKHNILKEAFRILKPDGHLSVLAMRVDKKQEAFQFDADFTFPSGEVSRTGFRIDGRQEQTLMTVESLLRVIGFKVIEAHDEGTWFSMCAVRQ
jgi:ubiquinone/menaquinone biosynthesis C-methylase UbiE